MLKIVRLSIALLMCLAAASNVGRAQQTQSSLQVTRIYGITSSWAGECGPHVIDNRSTQTRQNNYSSYYAVGSGVWTASMSYSDSSCGGPFTSFGSSAIVSNASGTPIGSGFGYHPYIQILITGNATVTYSAEKDFFINSGSGGGGGGGGACGNTGTPNVVPFSGNPTFNMGAGNVQVMTLSGTVTTVTFTNIIPFCPYMFYLCQDVTGAHTFNWPISVAGAMGVGQVGGRCSVQNFFAPDSSHLVATSPGVINM